MTIRYRTAGAWGPGEGTNLTAAQVDENFYTVDQKIDSEIAALPEPNGIANIVQDGTQITIILDDATEEGPFTLPQANFRPASPSWWLPASAWRSTARSTFARPAPTRSSSTPAPG
jgi:hypothetical protein